MRKVPACCREVRQRDSPLHSRLDQLLMQPVIAYDRRVTANDWSRVAHRS
jgi:hypothetical protein